MEGNGNQVREAAIHDLEELNPIEIQPPILSRIRAISAQINELNQRLGDLIELSRDMHGTPAEGFVCYHTEIGFVIPSLENQETCRRIGPMVQQIKAEQQVG